MKWLVIGLSLTTITIWCLVLFISLDLGEKTYVYTDKHVLLSNEKSHKNANFIFKNKKPFTDQVKKVDTSSELEKKKISFEKKTNHTNDNQTVSIDDILAALHLSIE